VRAAEPGHATATVKRAYVKAILGSIAFAAIGMCWDMLTTSVPMTRMCERAAHCRTALNPTLPYRAQARAAPGMKPRPRCVYSRTKRTKCSPSGRVDAANAAPAPSAATRRQLNAPAGHARVRVSAAVVETSRCCSPTNACS
jgi:hypothetical protein